MEIKTGTEIKRIDKTIAKDVANLMSRMKPDWWDYDGALGQITNLSLSLDLVGWYMEENSTSKGWVLCMGYDSDGEFVMEEELEPLLDRTEECAKKKATAT